MTAPSVLGRPLWYELMTSDMSAAEAFYKTVVGWSTTPFEGAGRPYDLWTRPDGTPMGGVMTLPDEVKAHNVPAHWLIYIGVDSLEGAVAKIQQLGGSTVTEVISIAGVGRIRVVKDPQGAVFCVFEPSSPPTAPDGDPVLGDASWHELYTTDNAAAMTFYGELFGWKPTESMDMGPMGVYRMFGRRGPGQSMGGMMTKTPDMAQVPTSWLPYFLVPDVHAAAERIKANGGKVVMGPMEVPGGSWILQGQDPQGGTFALHHLKK
jgi:predicted enzyme related to lactoylglutathione lyase